MKQLLSILLIGISLASSPLLLACNGTQGKSSANAVSIMKDKVLLACNGSSGNTSANTISLMQEMNIHLV